ncbi:MAG: hypothetical protein QOF02_3732 [Blastocatellia bacterium]|nr:hypothetical protein [Blastocatellia bacterium]
MLLLYCVGYAVCRVNRRIVHYTASVDGKCSFHDVDAGDAKMDGTLAAIAAFYTPLRYVELAFWKIAKPAGSTCS